MYLLLGSAMNNFMLGSIYLKLLYHITAVNTFINFSNFYNGFGQGQILNVTEGTSYGTWLSTHIIHLIRQKRINPT
jgi:hypothetical protein